jgi:selenocysteine-specific elongation factor
VRVSAKTRDGLNDLLAVLDRTLEEKPQRADLNRPRLPIDRVFTISGFGTVVTGTLSDGCFSLGEEVEILPSGKKGRIRGLQTHKKKEDKALPGSRTAINLSGIDAESIQRGEVVARPGQYQAVRRLDARLRLLRDASSPIRHGDEVKFFVGASESIAVLRLLGTEELQPGGEAWIQLELRRPIVAARGDKYILRRPSPSETLGGGVIVNHQPKGRHKRFDQAALNSLEALAKGTPAEILLQAALAFEAAPILEMIEKSRLEPSAAETALSELLDNGRLLILEDGAPTTTSGVLAIALPRWNNLREKIMLSVEAYHRQFPLRRGIPREELKSKLKLQPRIFGAVVQKLTAEGSLYSRSTWIAKPEHKIEFSAADQVKAAELMQVFKRSPFTPPSLKECQALAGEEVVNALVELGELTAVSQDALFRTQDYRAMLEKVQAVIRAKGDITLAEARDTLQTTRKYAQALLEHMDAVGITVRIGDSRRLKA